MPSRLRTLIDACARATLPAFVLVPAAAVVAAVAEVSRQDWMGQRLWFLAADHAVSSVSGAALWSFVLLVGALAAWRASSPLALPLAERTLAAAAAWGLLLYPAVQLLLPTFRVWQMRYQTDPWMLALFVIPESLVYASAVAGLLGWVLFRLRCLWSGLDAAASRLRFAPRWWPLVPGALLAAAPSLVAAVAPSPGPGAGNVILIVVDTLRADHLGMYGYDARATSPRLDEFARDAVVYERAEATAPWTTPSTASILTAQYPRRLGYRLHPVPLAPQVPTVAEVFRSLGFRTGAVVSNMFASTAVNFHSGFESMDEREIGDYLYVSSAGVTDRAIAWVERHQHEPFFLYLHYFDPHYAYLTHAPYDFAGGYRGKFRATMTEPELVASLPTMTDEDLAYLMAAYDSETALNDAHLGRFFDRLRELGLYDDATIVFTADHGEAFNERGDTFVGHGPFLYESTMHVPLLVKRRGQQDAGTRVSTPVSVLDVSPTLLETAGAAFPSSATIDGRPLSAAAAGRAIVGETYRHADRAAVYRDRFKLLVDRRGGTSALYDLVADPGETRDLSADRADLARELASLLETWSAAVEETEAAPVEFSEAEKERLRALGYAE